MSIAVNEEDRAVNNEFREVDMLLMHRFEGERLFIGNDVAITIVSIRDEAVLIGIQAPTTHKVVRYEKVRQRKNNAKQRCTME